MANTTFGVNDALAVKKWARSLAVEALNATDIAPLIGSDANSIIQRKTELKDGGDRVRIGLRMQLTGDGFTENEAAEGNGESLTLFSDDIVVNELGHVVGVASKNTIDQQRVLFDLRMEARDGLADWYAKRWSVSFFNQVCGYTAEANTKFTGLNAAVAPSSTHHLYKGSTKTDQGQGTSDTFTLDMIDKAVEIAKTVSPKIRPIRVNGADKWVMYIHPFQTTSLRTSTSTGQWLDIQKAAMQGGQVSDNPIFTNALGEYHNVIIRESLDVTQGVHSSTGAPVATTRRAVLLGAQAACIAFGKQTGVGRFRWNEETYDHKRRLEVSAWTIHGLKKLQFNAADFATVVVSTRAEAST